MSELIADLPFRVIDNEGRGFYVSVVGEPRPDGEWEGWLEYVPLDDTDVLVTRPEPRRRSRTAHRSNVGRTH